MQVVDIRCRFVRDDENRHSYQVFNAVTGNLIWACPDWYFTREECEKQAMDRKQKFVEDVKLMGLEARMGDDGNPIVEYDPTKPVPQLGLPAMVPPDKGDVPNLTSDQAKSVVVVAMAVHRTTGKYGVVVINGLGEVLIKPDKYVDTEKEAYELAMANREQMAAKLKELGYPNVKFMEVDRDSFTPEQTAPGTQVASSDVRRQFEREALQHNLGLFAGNKKTETPVS
jgi:hypothetical protein